MRKIFSILFIILLLMSFLSCDINLFAEEFKEINYSEETRKPVVSGTFYPDSAKELKEKIENLLNKVEKEELKGKLIGLIAPHAGYDFSGEIAAYAYKQLEGKNFDTVILIGESHYHRFPGASIGNYQSYQTPLGEVEVDNDLAINIIKYEAAIKFYPQVHQGEHSLEVQLPFLQTLLRDFKILPIILGERSSKLSSKIVKAILQELKGRDEKILFIASTDLSHFYPYQTALQLDNLTIKAIEKLDSDSFYQGLSYGNYYLCGGAAVGTLLKIAENLQANKIKLLKYANSGDITGDKSRVVGYAAFIISKNNPQLNLKEAYYYLELGDSEVQCLLCPRECILAEGQRGICGVRQNIKGKLYTLVYGRPVAVHVDPIEKKPISHMLPGSKSFSIATAGCNLGCRFCQNWQISQVLPEEIRSYDLPPEKVVQLALENNCQSIAYTYSEPTIFYEYMIETAKLAHQKGLKNVYVTSGYINPEPLRELCKYIDAANLDIKGFTEDYYRKYCLGKLQPVLESAKIIQEEGVWIELTNLILPTINDDMEVIREMCEWIIKNLGPDVPLYFSRFFPAYKITYLPPTPVETLEKAREIALDVGLHYVYIGNVPGHPAEHTYCPNCGKLLIQRVGFFVTTNNLNENRCPSCGEKIPGIWK